MSANLTSPRLTLDRYTPGDEDAFVALFSDDRVSQWMGDGPASEHEDRALFGRIFGIYEQNRFDVWAVRRDGILVGHAELKHTDTVDGHEVIYALAADQWGQGLGTELARTVLSYGFDTLDLPAIYATVHQDNYVSLDLLQRKVGFQRVGETREEDGSITVVLIKRSEP